MTLWVGGSASDEWRSWIRSGQSISVEVICSDLEMRLVEAGDG